MGGVPAIIVTHVAVEVVGGSKFLWARCVWQDLEGIGKRHVRDFQMDDLYFKEDRFYFDI